MTKNYGACSHDDSIGRATGKVAVSWLKILAANPNPNRKILSHETAT